MKLKSLAVSIAAGGLFAAAGPCFAVPCSTLANLAAWQAAVSCTDIDSDTTWFFGSTTLPLTTTFSISETGFAGGDLYNVAFNFSPALTTPATGEFITYTAVSSPAEMFDAADYDSNVTEGTGVSGAVSTAQITGPGLTLTSTDGSHAPPPSGETPFAAILTIGVTDTLNTIPAGAVYNAFNNSFQTGTVLRVPEPISLALVGVGLLGMGLVRRKRMLS